MTNENLVRLATRGSALALWQTNRVADLIRTINPDLTVEPVVISTRPDRDQEMPLSAMGGDKGLFVKEVELAVLDGRADAAVHSLKDVPVDVTTPGLDLVAFPERATPADVWISRDGATPHTLPAGRTVATSAPRRRAQLLALRPDLHVCEVRGNVETRLRKLDEGQFDAIILAAAGLERLGLEGRITHRFTANEFLPAPGQGILVVQAPTASTREDLWRQLDNPAVRLQAEGERAFSRAIGATCHTAAGCLIEVNDTTVTLTAAAFSADGQRAARFTGQTHTGAIDDLVARAAATLHEEGYPF